MTDWVQEKAQKVRQAFSEKTMQVQQLMERLQQALKSNKDCLMQGVCQPGQRNQMISLAKQISIAIVALIALAAAAVVAAKMMGDSGAVAGEKAQGVQAVSIQSIANKFGVTIPTDDSPPSLFIRAVQNGVPSMVKSLTDLVSDKVLQVGKELAQLQRKIYANEAVPAVRKRLQGSYDEISNYIDNALRMYSESNLHKNIDFIYAATTGLVEEVKARFCDAMLTPSKNAIEEAIQRIRSKVTTSHTYKEIMEFINHPTCER